MLPHEMARKEAYDFEISHKALLLTVGYLMYQFWYRFIIFETVHEKTKKQKIGFPTRSNADRSVLSQKNVRSLKFRI